ncbi:hypothetical protein IEQ34_026448 [Dendrobium chrysotoxum]|uniref:Ubiquitin-like protease family profile domain-containing protein n=1 Tax=Dendrobium chrysotoxum TaxID=161865 RepID=A0AAV7FM70_DENCH|nr:hypothetical protein IEQ34_026448 [Dendrobium chrysotoxum]
MCVHRVHTVCTHCVHRVHTVYNCTHCVHRVHTVYNCTHSMYIPKITCRCRASTFRNVCDSLKEFFTDEVKETLKRLRILQFTEFPPFQQNTPLIYMLLSCWDVSKQSFNIKGHELKFSADDVALLTGLPNTGSLIYWEAEPLTSYTGIQIKNEMKNIKKSTSPDVIVNMYIKFLLSNLFFPNNNYRTPRRLISIAQNIDEFNSYNWAMSIRDFLVNQLDRLAPKYVQDEPLGYMSGFVPLLMIWFLEHTSIRQPALPEARPRFLRWDSNIFLSAVQISQIFKDLRNKQINKSFENVTEEEEKLFAEEFPTPQTFPTHPTLPTQLILSPVHPSSPISPVFHLSGSPEKVEPTYESPKKGAMDSHLQSPKHQIFSPPVPQYSPRIPQLPDESIVKELTEIRAFITILTNELDYPDSEHPSTSAPHEPCDLATTSVPPQPPKHSELATTPAPDQPPKHSELATTSSPDQPAQPADPATTSAPDQPAKPADPATTSVPDQPAKPAEKRVSDEGVLPGEPTSKNAKTSTIASTVKRRTNRTKKAVRTPFTAGKRRLSKKKEADKEKNVIGPKPTDGAKESEVMVDVEAIPYTVTHSSSFMDFKGRDLISETMLNYMDFCFAKYTDKQKTILAAGNVSVSRGEVDELITEQYLSDAHVDAFAYLLAEKNKLFPGLYKTFLYISCLYYSYARENYQDISSMYVKHITRDAVQEADYVMCTLCHDRHWTLLAGVVKGKYWAFFGSLPKDHHKKILNDVIQKLHGDIGQSFDTDIRIWPITYPSGVPTQTNSIDCGMFVCKYMEELVKHGDVDWEQHKNLQDKMTLFRVELAYAILCSLAK